MTVATQECPTTSTAHDPVDQGPISVLAARYAQLRGSAGAFNQVTAQLEALDELMLYAAPTTPDEILTIIRLVWEGIDDNDPRAGALESVCEALERDGARNLRYREEPAAENDPE